MFTFRSSRKGVPYIKRSKKKDKQKLRMKSTNSRVHFRPQEKENQQNLAENADRNQSNGDYYRAKKEAPLYFNQEGNMSAPIENEAALNKRTGMHEWLEQDFEKPKPQPIYIKPTTLKIQENYELESLSVPTVPLYQKQDLNDKSIQEEAGSNQGQKLQPSTLSILYDNNENKVRNNNQTDVLSNDNGYQEAQLPSNIKKLSQPSIVEPELLSDIEYSNYDDIIIKTPFKPIDQHLYEYSGYQTTVENNPSEENNFAETINNQASSDSVIERDALLDLGMTSIEKKG